MLLTALHHKKGVVMIC